MKIGRLKALVLKDSQSGMRSRYFKKMRSVQLFSTFYTTIVQEHRSGATAVIFTIQFGFE